MIVAFVSQCPLKVSVFVGDEFFVPSREITVVAPRPTHNGTFCVCSSYVIPGWWRIGFSGFVCVTKPHEGRIPLS